MSGSTSSQASLLGLPAELRNRIYTLEVTHEHNLYMTTLKPEPQGRLISERSLPTKEPPILLIWRQIRNEALPIFYGQNIFQASDLLEFLQWLRNLSSQTRDKLRHVRLVDRKPRSDIVSAAEKVRELETALSLRGCALPSGALYVSMVKEGHVYYTNGTETID